MRRIQHQTCTEIEPISWADGAIRYMGFSIIGSESAIQQAIREMVSVVRKMDVSRAVKIIQGHLKPEKKEEPAPKSSASAAKKSAAKASTSASATGSKLPANICAHFLKGNCRFGVNCRYSHSKGNN